ncbi:MAG: nitroreductase [Enterocloster asparagiformis]|nr:nitroreductase [Enterocloster asparagiformis]
MKQEALEVLKNRRSIRKFKAEQITKEELHTVLEAGTYAPTAAGTQAPFIVAVQNPDTVAKLDAMNAQVLNLPQMQHPYYGAPTILIVLSPRDGHAPVEDASLVAGNLMNAAYAAGLGSCWIHRGREMFESEDGKALLRQWGLPDNLLGVATIALGYPDGASPSAAPRKDHYITEID